MAYVILCAASLHNATRSTPIHCTRLPLHPPLLNTQATLEAGLSGCRMLNEKVPNSVVEWLVSYHNTFHGGSAYTILQLLGDCQDIEKERVPNWVPKGRSGGKWWKRWLSEHRDRDLGPKEWNVHKHESGITVQGAGGSTAYDRMYGDWVRRNFSTKVTPTRPLHHGPTPLPPLPLHSYPMPVLSTHPHTYTKVQSFQQYETAKAANHLIDKFGACGA